LKEQLEEALLAGRFSDLELGRGRSHRLKASDQAALSNHREAMEIA